MLLPRILYRLTLYICNRSRLKGETSRVIRNRHVKDCAAFFVCCADLKRLEMACEKHGTEIKHEGVEDFIVAT